MIYNRSGAQFEYRDITYTIGGKVYANDESVYAGLYGVIREIRTGEDLETDHDTPDIYCEFMPPVLPDEIKAFETHFSHLYGTEKRLDDVGIDMVIMAPDMLVVLDPQKDAQSLEIFLVREDWAIDDDYGTSTQIVADYHMAKFHFNNLVFQEMIDGCIQKWTHRQDLETDTRKDFYECWLHDEYYENHYTIHHDEYADGIITSQTRINRVVWGGYSVEKKVPGKDSQMINLKTETASGGQLIDGIMHPLEVIEEYKNSNRTDRVVRAKYIRDDSGRIVQVEIIQGGNTSSDKGVIVQTNYFEYDEMNRIIKQTVAYLNGDTHVMIYSYENDLLKNATEYDATGGEIKQLCVNVKDGRTVIEVKSDKETIEIIYLEYDRQGRITRIVHEDPNGRLLSETAYSYEFWNALAGVHGVVLIIVAIFLTAFILVHTYSELINQRYKRAKSVTVYAKVLTKLDGGTETVPTAGHHIIVETAGGILNLAIEQNQYVLIREGNEGNLTHKGGWFESLHS